MRVVTVNLYLSFYHTINSLIATHYDATKFRTMLTVRCFPPEILYKFRVGAGYTNKQRQQIYSYSGSSKTHTGEAKNKNQNRNKPKEKERKKEKGIKHISYIRWSLSFII